MPRVLEMLRRALLFAGWVLLAAGFTMVVLALFLPTAQAQISPGPLSKPHASLAGPSGCTQCHAVSAGSPTFRCLDCHREIGVRLQRKSGLHSVLMDPNAGNAACVRCHSEHNGENFSLVKWDPSPKSFDHRRTGWPLDGKHTELSCKSCHTPAKIAPAERIAIGTRDLNRTYLGLSHACTSCHEDKHRGELGANCLQCHNTVDWKRSFDHSKTRFALKGAHLQVRCQKCHASAADGLPKYTGLKFERCSSCHSDPHRGAFAQQTCESCHNLSSWKQSSFAARFDHSKTNYPLLGKHAELRCETCHRNGDFKSAIAHQVCADCHKPDPHNGQFLKRADGGRCESCHTVDGFNTTTFAVSDHNRTGFPLRGKHAAVACAKCHVPAGRDTLFRVKFAQCVDCHQDTHGRQFAGAPYWNRCDQCHSDATFLPATFTVTRHQQSRFVLTGGHMAVACNDCHKPAGNARTATFHFDSAGCTACHGDPHRNQFAERMAKLDAKGRALGCEACHSTKTWNELERFDHASTGFQLSGAHRAVDCAGCHRPANLERTLRSVDFKSAPAQCEACHEDAHGKQFARGNAATRCADCHTTTKWRPSLFNHELTKFSLSGAHQNVRCSACHVKLQAVNGKDVLFYKPVPTACAACHGTNAAAGKGL